MDKRHKCNNNTQLVKKWLKFLERTLEIWKGSRVISLNSMAEDGIVCILEARRVQELNSGHC
jgi:hypothetical protein